MLTLTIELTVKTSPADHNDWISTLIASRAGDTVAVYEQTAPKTLTKDEAAEALLSLVGYDAILAAS